MSGQQLGPYQLEALVGVGGMGEVYRARDVDLGRTVAIKLVRLDDDRARARLRREAQNASSLNHPNICTIHQVGDRDGRPFIVMEFVEGRLLAEMIPPEGLPAIDALRYAIQIADALIHAHEHGLVHRDLKSSNVMVTPGGLVKLLDFGLSKRIAAPASGDTAASAWSQSGGAIAGTLGYMAPEVLQGLPADIRTDVWAVGVLLYEMTTGHLPFAGRTAFELSSAILSQPPSPMPERVPPAFGHIIRQCLEKEPDQRYQEARAVKHEMERFEAGDVPHAAGRPRRLKAAATGRVAGKTPVHGLRAPRRVLIILGLVAAAAVSVAGGWLWMRPGPAAAGSGVVKALAVLPLKNVSGDPSQDYFADGITEALIADLGKAAGVRVISRTTVMLYRNTGKSLPQIARDLNVDAILEGSVLRSGNRVRVTAELFDARADRQLWAETSERTLREILVLQRDIVRAVAGKVRVALTGEDDAHLSVVRSVDPDVYEHYLKGRYAWNNRTEASLNTAVEEFRAATEADPTYAAPFVGLADCYNQLGTVMVGGASPIEMRPRAAAAALAALQIDDSLGEAHAALAYVRHYDWQWEDAGREFQRAIALSPNYALAHLWYANYLVSMNRLDDAVDSARRAQTLDPMSRVVLTNVGWTLAFAGRHVEAIDEYLAALALDPSYVQARWRLAGSYAELSRFDEAIAQAERAVALTGRSPSTLSLLGGIYAQAGRRSEARALLVELTDMARRKYVSPSAMAGLCAKLGDVDGAFRWLERCFEERSNGLAYLGQGSSVALLRNDPRYKDLFRRIGRPIP
jgi:serine/threonine-protein kinase